LRQFIQSVVACQCRIRCWTARQKMKDLRKEARDVGKLVQERERIKAEAVAMKAEFERAQESTRAQAERESKNLRQELQTAKQKAETEFKKAIEDAKAEAAKEIERLASKSEYRDPGNTNQESSSKASLAFDIEAELKRVTAENREKDKEIARLKSELETLCREHSFCQKVSKQDEGDRNANRTFQEPNPSFATPLKKLQTLTNRVLPKLTVTTDAQDGMNTEDTTSGLITPREKTPDIVKNAAKVLLSSSKYLQDRLGTQQASWDEPEGIDTEWTDKTSDAGDLAETPSIAASSTFIADDQSISLLHEAVCAEVEEDVVKALEEASHLDMEINQGDEEGRAPLHLAVMRNNKVIVELLVQHSAMCNAQDVLGNTPLHYAKDVSIMKILVEQGHASPNIPNSSGRCALHFAVSRHDPESVQFLIDHGADVDVADDVQWLAPLHLIATCRSLDADRERGGTTSTQTLIASMLCEGKADVNAKDSLGNTPLHAAAKLSYHDALNLIKIFMDHGGDPSITNVNDQTPLKLLCHSAALRKFAQYHDTVELLASRAHPGAASRSGCTALHLALYNQDIECAVILVRYGADLNATWRKPEEWEVFWNHCGSPLVLPLDMVRDDFSLRRLLSVVKKPQSWAMSRPLCMECKSLFGTFVRHHHCRHCGRLVCGKCSSGFLDESYFPELFLIDGKVKGEARVCCVCEDVLMSRERRNEMISPACSSIRRPLQQYPDDITMTIQHDSSKSIENNGKYCVN
jgi:ankyrin repeat protein